MNGILLRAFAFVSVCAALSTLGCQDEAFCFDCDPAANTGGTGGTATGTGGEPNIIIGEGGSANGPGGGNCFATNTIENCGRCGNRCARDNATAACVLEGSSYVCQYECQATARDLDGDLDTKDSNGCEYTCIPTEPATEVCDGLDNDCDGDVDNALSGETADDFKNCGACGTVCAFENASAACVNGKCVLPADPCLPGFVDADGKPENGCELQCTRTNQGVEKCDGLDNDCDGVKDDVSDEDLAEDLRNCGSCGNSCVGAFPHAVPACVSGECKLSACEPGFYDKNLEAEDGCEASCNCTRYPFTVTDCTEGVCGTPRCIDDYHDLDQDIEKNGCEYRCIPSNGGVELCDNEDNDCNGKVDDGVDVSTDPNHCGGCGQRCAGVYANSGAKCEAGACVAACLSGYFDKNGDGKNPAGNGCEFSCFDCAFTNATANTASCLTNGACKLGSCSSDYWNLDGNDTNGCEYGCRLNGATQDANTSKPETLCNGQDDDCDKQVDEGFDLKTDANNCGRCGLQCDAFFPNANGVCTNGACTRGACDAGYVDLDASAANGCECKIAGAEVCNGVDDDCDGQVDEGVTVAASACTAYQTASCGGVAKCVAGAPVCSFTTSPETCDGKDNDCDGQTDESSLAEPLPGVGQLCGTVAQVGRCKLGQRVCQSGALVCQGEVGPIAETCNGVDDDCDGQTDESIASIPSACTAYQNANCSGSTTCVNGVPTCRIVTTTEVCDGKDNDCDQQTDETSPGSPLPGLGASCGTVPQVGRCQLGTYTACTSGALVCTGQVGPVAESCNGIDDDCDGQTDEGIVSMPTACTAYQTSTCSGQTVCVSGSRVCVTASTEEVCDGVDNDCDQQVDESPLADPLPGLGELCGTAPQLGKCQLGTYTAFSSGSFICSGEVGPSTEVCNGIDDDCDGQIDDGVTPADVCSAVRKNVCGGTTQCINGTATCVFTPGQEVCNGIDDDCDGQTDEGTLPQIGQPCGNVQQIGRCKLGTYTACTSGALVCTGVVSPTNETCNGQDDDCDGQIDEGITGDIHAVGAACPPLGGSTAGLCENGTWQCQQSYSGGNLTGTWVCQGAVNPADEVCDSGPLDEDCNSQSNEGCLKAGPAATRLDTGGGSVTGSAQGQHSSFQVAAASYGDTYLVAYADLRDQTAGAPYAQPRLYGKVSTNGGTGWQGELAMPPFPANLTATYSREAESNDGIVARDDTWNVVTDWTASGRSALRAEDDDDSNINAGDAPTQSPRVRFTFNFAAGGTYYVWLRGRGDGNADRCHVGINDVISASGANVGNFSSQYTWRGTNTGNNRVTITVPGAGNHNVDVWMREDGFWFDSILLTTDVNYTPSGTLNAVPNGGRVEPNLFLHTNRAYLTYSEFAQQAQAGRVRRVYMSRADRGNADPRFATWSTPVRLDNLDGGGLNGNVDLFSPKGVVARVGASTATDYVAVVWSAIDASNASAPTRNIFLSYSKNGGTSWATPIQVNPTADYAELPALAADGQGMVSVAWRQKTVGVGATNRIWVRRIDLNAGSPAFETAVALEAAAAGQSSDDVSIAADSLGNLHVLWTDIDDKSVRVATGESCGALSSASACANSFNVGGAILNTDGRALGATIAAPTLAVRDGAAIVAWEDSRSGYSDIRLNRAVAPNWTWSATSQRADGDALGAAQSMNPRVAFTDGGRAVVTWEDVRDDVNGLTTSVYANVSLDDGITFYSGAGAYAVRLDTSNAADSLQPLLLGHAGRVLSVSNTSRTSVIWLDYVTASNQNGENGDVYTRLLIE
jgi:hypothetical protein